MNYFQLLNYSQAFGKAFAVTVSLAALACLAGSLLAATLVVARTSKNSVLRWTCDTYTTFVKGVPALVLLIWIYYAAPTLVDLTFSPYLAAFIALSINISPFLADSLHSGIQSISSSQYESALLAGLSPLDSYRHVIFPQVMRNILPDLLSWFITVLKLTSLASVIGLNELLHTGNVVISDTFRPFEVYTFVALFYLIATVSLEALLERHMNIEYRRVIQ